MIVRMRSTAAKANFPITTSSCPNTAGSLKPTKTCSLPLSRCL